MLAAFAALVTIGCLTVLSVGAKAFPVFIGGAFPETR